MNGGWIMAENWVYKKDEGTAVAQISLNDLITALTVALDLAGGSDRKHSLRTAYVATRLASIMPIPKLEVDNIYYAALLHDLIPAQSYFNQELIFDIIASLSLNSQVAGRVAELWKYKRNNQVKASLGQLSFSARIIYLAEYFENLYCNGEKDAYLVRRPINFWIRSAVAGVDNRIAEAFNDCVREEAFWQDLRENRINRAVRQVAPDWRQQLNVDDIEKMSRSFSLLIDRKNPYTGEHSQRVGAIAGHCARLYGLDTVMVRKISIAGYMHDLGKLSVPEAILNKPGSLSELEMQVIKAHPYNSYAVLSEVEGFADIARWAGNHHERMDGSGYPWGKRDLTILDQIIAVADIYEALTSNRPYRQALSADDALNLIKNQVIKGEIMADAYGLLEAAIVHGGGLKEQGYYGDKDWLRPVYSYTQAK